MNCPSRTDEPEGDGYNQNPSHLAKDLTTREDFNGGVNERELGRSLSELELDKSVVQEKTGDPVGKGGERVERRVLEAFDGVVEDGEESVRSGGSFGLGGGGGGGKAGKMMDVVRKGRRVAMKLGKFVGPGFIVRSPFFPPGCCIGADINQISVAYIDPGNYSTDVAAGASHRFKLLFVVLMSNIFAIFLQSLCIKLGTVSGLNLAEACKEFLPKWMNIALYIFAEAAVCDSHSSKPLSQALINILDHCY